MPQIEDVNAVGDGNDDFDLVLFIPLIQRVQKGFNVDLVEIKAAGYAFSSNCSPQNRNCPSCKMYRTI